MKAEAMRPSYPIASCNSLIEMSGFVLNRNVRLLASLGSTQMRGAQDVGDPDHEHERTTTAASHQPDTPLRYTVAAAAESLQISERQMYRLLSRHKKDGDKGIIHRLRGKTSNSGYALLVRSHVMKLYQERYSDYGSTLFSEILSESHHITIDSDTLRRWLKGAKLWNGARAARLHRQKRARREAVG